jgi:MurNAc alpha-1-phosphate uridylyltransferase
MAGGSGRRLASLGVPKALAPIAGTTLLAHQLARTARLQPASTVVLLHHEAKRIAAQLPDRAAPLIEPSPLGTAGGLSMLPSGPSAWLVLNVDHISDVDLVALTTGWVPPCTAVLSTVRVPVDEGVVELSGGQVVAWRERPILQLPVTTGLYVFSAEALRQVLDGSPIDMPALIERLMPEGVHAWQHQGTWIDAGTPDRLATAERLLLAG